MNEADVPRLLIEADHAYLTAPAGCGKTEVIARAVALSTVGRQLVLTHTHAGVWALRRRLRTLGVPRALYNVETIAGWALKYATSYPSLSNLTTDQPTGDEWSGVYAEALSLLPVPAIKSVIHSSYSGLFVDEYQDCTQPQHQMILRLSELLPTRIVGDPLQGIFDFTKDPLVDWDADVYPSFTPLPTLLTPWRWKDANPQLGTWLMDVRAKILAGTAIDLAQAPVTWGQATPDVQRTTCLNHASRFRKESVVAIRLWPQHCHRIARSLLGTFSSMEEMDCRDLLHHAGAIETSVGADRALAVLEFGRACFSGLSALTGTMTTALKTGRAPRVTAKCPNPAFYRAADVLIHSATLTDIIPFLQHIRELPTVRLYRRELWREMMRAVQAFASGGHETLRDAAWVVRNQTRHAGRPEERHSVSRTLLIKGLEYDHCVLLDADEFVGKRKHLYVALTRGRQSVTILSSQPVLTV